MGGYAKYIATREGVEKIDDSQRHAPATIKQQELIMRILRDFPDAKESHEYEDYRREKTVGNASEFITRALEENMDRVADSKTYADYIATRPRAERFGSHGLFTDDGVQVQLHPILPARSISRKKAGRTSKKPSSTSGRRQRLAILLRNISWGGSTISETVFVRIRKRDWNI